VKVEWVNRAYFEPLPASYYLTDYEADLLRNMRDDYARRYKKQGFANRYAVALAICARAFDIPALVLAEPRDQTRPKLVEDRKKLMAFCRVVSCTVHPATPNTWKGIADKFNRKHPTVIHATQQYGAQIAAALEMTR
jgi:hypothetical protein